MRQENRDGLFLSLESDYFYDTAANGGGTEHLSKSGLFLHLKSLTEITNGKKASNKNTQIHTALNIT